MPNPSYLYARTHEPRHVAIRHLLDSIADVASVTETRTFSGLLLMMKLELSKSALHELPERLGAIHVPLEPPSVELVHELETKGPETVDVVLDVQFVDGNPDVRDEIPPG